MKKHAYLIASLSFLLVFIVFTILVKTVDVEMIYNGTYLGFHELNFNFGNMVVNFGKYDSSKLFSDIILYVSFGYSLVLVVFSIIHLIKVKSLKLVDKRYYILLGSYVSIALVYLLFELVKVNYSPESTASNLKPSYPSSHVFIGMSLFLINSYTALSLLDAKKEWVIYLTYGSTIVICILMLLTRSLSSKHWLTDIIASVILVISQYLAFIYIFHRFTRHSDDVAESIE